MRAASPPPLAPKDPLPALASRARRVLAPTTIVTVCSGLQLLTAVLNFHPPRTDVLTLGTRVLPERSAAPIIPAPSQPDAHG